MHAQIQSNLQGRSAVAAAWAGAHAGRQRPLRVLCIGGEDHAFRLPFLCRLKAAGFEVHAAANCPSVPFEAAGIPFHPYALNRSFNPAADWAAVRDLHSIVEAVRADVVQSFDTKPNLYAAILADRSRGTTFIRTINGTGRVYSSSTLSARALRPVYNLIQRRAAVAGAITVFQNEADRTFFRRSGMVLPSAAHLIRGSGIDIEAFDRAAQAGFDIASLKQQLGLTASNIILTVTRVEPMKGIRTLLAASELVHAVAPDTQFVVAGPWEKAGPDHERLCDLCRRSESLRWIGPRSDIQALLALATMFVLPTEFREGLPRVLLEAGLAQLPIVTTDMPGCTSVVEHGCNGLIVPPRDPGALATAVLELMASPARARAFGRAGAERVRRDFSLDGVTQKYAALYRDKAPRTA